jgi:hypothetical protein
MPRAPHSTRAGELTPKLISAWSTLLDRAEAFRDLAPWRWVNGTSILGVRDQNSGETDWCSIMGQGGETFGVAIYQGDRGLGSLQRMLRDGSDPFDACIQQVAAVLTFNDRDMLTKDMVAVLKACGRRYRGANAWPELVIHDPGYFPMPPMTVDGIQRLTIDLESLFGMCVQAAKDPGWDQHDEQDQPWVAKPDPGGMTAVMRESMPTIPDPPMPVIVVDEVAAARIRAKGGRSGAAVLIDWFVGSAVIDGPEAAGRPYFVAHATAFDLRTGMILGMEMCRLAQVWQETAGLLLKVSETGGVPHQIMVRRPEAVTILGPLAQALGTDLVHSPETADAIAQFKHQLDAFGR